MTNLQNYTDLAIIQPGVAILALLTTRVGRGANPWRDGHSLLFSFQSLVDRGWVYAVEFSVESPTSPSIDWTTDRSSSNRAIDAAAATDSTGWIISTGTQWIGATSQPTASIDGWWYVAVLSESPVESNRWECDCLWAIYTFDRSASLSTSTESIRFGHHCTYENSRIVE